jgi:hypothetical protein
MDAANVVKLDNSVKASRKSRKAKAVRALRTSSARSASLRSVPPPYRCRTSPSPFGLSRIARPGNRTLARQFGANEPGAGKPAPRPNLELAHRIAAEDEYFPGPDEFTDLDELKRAGLVVVAGLYHPVAVTDRLSKAGRRWLAANSN